MYAIYYLKKAMRELDDVEYAEEREMIQEAIDSLNAECEDCKALGEECSDCKGDRLYHESIENPREWE
jgi:hypothetical protein